MGTDWSPVGQIFWYTLKRGIGSDSQRPFAIAILGGLSATLVIGVFVLPTIYLWIARDRIGCDRDELPPAEVGFED